MVVEYKLLITNRNKDDTIRWPINIKREPPSRGVHMLNIDGLVDPQPGPRGMGGVLEIMMVHGNWVSTNTIPILLLSCPKFLHSRRD